MNILWIRNIHLKSALYKTAVIEMIKALSKRGNNVYLIVPKSSYENHFVTILYLPCINTKYFSSLFFSFMLIFYLPQYINRKRINVVITDYQSSLVSVFISRILNVKIFLDIRSPPFSRKGIYEFLSKMQYKLSIKLAKSFCHGITVVTNELKEDICSKFNIKNSYVGVWSSGVSTTFFKPYTEKNKHLQNLREIFGLSGKFVVMYHGSLSLFRGLARVLDAIKILKTDYPEIFLFMLGSGSGEKQLKDLIKEKNLQNNVIIYGPVDDEEVPKYLSICDVGIVPWPINHFFKVNSPLKLLEYLSMEKPAIVTALPFQKALINQAKCGVIIPSNHPNKISAAIKYLYDNINLLPNMAKRGRKLVEQHHTWDIRAQELEKFIMTRLI